MVWIDWLIILFVILGAFQGFWRGFVAIVFQIVGFIAAVLISLWAYGPVGSWLESQIHVSITLARPIALAAIFLMSIFAMQKAAGILHKILAPVIGANVFNKGAGAAAGAVQQLLIASFVLALLVTLPIPASVKAAMDTSKLARPLIGFGLRTEQFLSQRFGGDGLKSLSYNIVGKEQKTTTALNYTVADPKVDLEGAAKLFLITNETRKKADKPALGYNDQLRRVAEDYARDMLKRGYFSHLSPEGDDVVVRVRKASITATVVGENLANAATVELAQLGLMASAGHRDNILSTEFNEMGIGVLDAGSHGKMIVQVFARTY